MQLRGPVEKGSKAPFLSISNLLSTTSVSFGPSHRSGINESASAKLVSERNVEYIDIDTEVWLSVSA